MHIAVWEKKNFNTVGEIWVRYHSILYTVKNVGQRQTAAVLVTTNREFHFALKLCQLITKINLLRIYSVLSIFTYCSFFFFPLIELLCKIDIILPFFLESIFQGDELPNVTQLISVSHHMLFSSGYTLSLSSHIELFYFPN